MNARRSQRVLAIALAASLLIHAIGAFILRTLPHVEAAPERLPTTIRITRIAHPSPPPPTPVPVTTATPRPVTRTAAQPAHAVHAVPQMHRTLLDEPPARTAPDGPGPAAAGPVAPAVTGPATGLAGTPAPEPKPACSQPFAEARVVEPMQPVVPDDTEAFEGIAQIAVTLDASGHVTNATIYRSTTDARYDRAAVVAARESTYAPAIDNCLPVGGTYLFRVDFQQ
jgi:TonB family protein